MGQRELRLRAGRVTAVVDAERGGALASLNVAGRDLLLPPTAEWLPYPRWGSFLMAPWVGPLSDGRLTFREGEWHLPQNEDGHAVHGLVAGVAWTVEALDERSAAIIRSLDGLWPFGGLVRQEIELEGDAIKLAVEIRSADVAMPVAAGWHPWFARGSGDVAVRVEAGHHLVHHGDVPTGDVDATAGEIDLRDGPALGNRRIDVVYVDAESPARLTTSDVDLTIESDPLIETLVVYTPPQAVCLEPWSAWPDASRLHSLGRPTGLIVLEPDEVFRRWTRWSWG